MCKTFYVSLFSYFCIHGFVSGELRVFISQQKFRTMEDENFIFYSPIYNQGLCVATLFCFCNGEVMAQVKRRWRIVFFRPRANSYTATQVSVRSRCSCLRCGESKFIEGNFSICTKASPRFVYQFSVKFYFQFFRTIFLSFDF